MDNKQEQKRKLKNFLLKPHYQMKVSAYFVLCQFCLFGLTLILVFKNFLSFRRIVALESPGYFSFAEHLDKVFDGTVFWISISFIVMGIITALYAILVTHKVVGPTHAILARLDQMKKGDYQSRRKLRPTDELVPIMESLDELAEKLESKSTH